MNAANAFRTSCYDHSLTNTSSLLWIDWSDQHFYSNQVNHKLTSTIYFAVFKSSFKIQSLPRTSFSENFITKLLRLLSFYVDDCKSVFCDKKFYLDKTIWNFIYISL